MQDRRRLHLYSIAYDVFSSIVKYSFALFIITLVHNCMTLATHLLAISSSYYISVVHHLNQWKLLYLRVLSSIRYLCVTLSAICSHTYLYYGVWLCIILVHVYMYVYTWRIHIHMEDYHIFLYI